MALQELFAPPVQKNAASGLASVFSSAAPSPVTVAPTVPQPSFLQKVGNVIKEGAIDPIINAIKSDISQTKEAFTSGIQQANQAAAASKTAPTVASKANDALKFAGGIASAVSSPLAAVFAPINKGVASVEDMITNVKAVQDMASKLPNLPYDKLAEAAGNISNIAGTLAGGLDFLKGKAPEVPTKLPVTSETPTESPVKITLPKPEPTATPQKNTATLARTIEEQVPGLQYARAYDIADRANLLKNQADIHSFIQSEIDKISFESVQNLPEAPSTATIPPEQLPTIQMGPKAAELPTIQTEPKSSNNLGGGMTLEPIKPPVAPKTAPQAIPSPYTKELAAKNIQPKALEPVLERPQAQNGERVTKAAHDVNETLVRQGLEQLPTEEQSKYTTGSYKDSVAHTTKLMTDNLESVKQMARTGENIPEGIHPQILFNAVEALATKEKDVNLLRDLAKSPLGTQLSEAGGTLGSHGFNDNPNSTVKIIRDVNEARSKAIEKKGTNIKKEKAKDANTFKSEVKKSRSSRQSWGEFAKQVACNI